MENKTQAPGDSQNTSPSKITYPAFIKKTGLWPINISLFLFYSNIVSILAMLFITLTSNSTALSNPAELAEKVNGVSMISAVLTLGLTIIYKRKFYLFKETVETE